MHLCTVYIPELLRCLVLEGPYQSISEGKSLLQLDNVALFQNEV